MPTDYVHVCDTCSTCVIHCEYQLPASKLYQPPSIRFTSLLWLNLRSLVPRPRPAFHHLQYIKVGRACYLFSCESDVNGKWQKVSERKSQVLHIVWPTTSSMLGMYDSCPMLAMCGNSPSASRWDPVHRHSIKSFLSPFYPWCHTREKRCQALRILHAAETAQA